MQGTRSISTVLRITLMVLLILLFLGAGHSISRYLLLTPELITDGWQLWRLVTYPLAASAWSLLLGALAFSQPGEMVEDLLGIRTFGILLVGISVGTGLLHALLFSGTGIPLAGMVNPAVVVAVGYLYLYPRGEARILFLHVRNSILGGGIILLSLVLVGLQVGSSGEPLLVLTSGVLPMFVGLVWFHLRFQSWSVLPSLSRRLGRFVGADRGRVPGQLASNRTEASGRITRERQGPTPAQRADALLDKIAEKGVEGLSEEEKEFLDDYSRRM